VDHSIDFHWIDRRREFTSTVKKPGEQKQRL
jgi:hypothetical protein